MHEGLSEAFAGSDTAVVLPPPACLRGDEDAQTVAAVLTATLTPAALGRLLRVCLDAAIKSATTGRHRVDDLQKSEKTAIGTQVEMAVREALTVPEGSQLDLLVRGIEVDVKWSTGNSKAGTGWMVPHEAFGHLVFLLTAWDTPRGSFFSAGLLRVRPDASNLNNPNQDQKRGVPKKTRREQVWWFYENEPMPGNLLLQLSEQQRRSVMDKPAGAQRIAAALIHVSGPVDPTQVALLDVPDPMRRLPEVNDLLRSQGWRVQVDTSGNWSAIAA